MCAGHRERGPPSERKDIFTFRDIMHGQGNSSAFVYFSVLLTLFNAPFFPSCCISHCQLLAMKNHHARVTWGQSHITALFDC